MKRLFYPAIIALLGGCASQVPIPIKEPPPGNPTVAEVRQDGPRFAGSAVRWGGVITQVENKRDRTWVEVVSRELDSHGEPISGSRSDGRFIASFPGFIDPIVYGAGQRLTVAGTIKGESTRPIGEYSYTFPIVTVSTSYLWGAEAEPARYDPPPPWYYDPWWPYYPGPFYHRPYPPYRW